MRPTTYIPAMTLAVAMLSTACSESITAPGPVMGNGSPVGSFALVSVNGSSVPYKYDEGPVSGGMIQAYQLAGEVTIKADSTFTIKITSKVTGPGQSGNPDTDTWTGTWRLDEDVIIAKNSGGTAYWYTDNQMGSFTMSGSFTKMTGGKGDLEMEFRKQ